MVLNMLTTLGQWEREVIGERTSAAIRQKQAQGEYIGGLPPYGHAAHSDGSLVPCSEERAVIALACGLRRKGLSLRAVAHGLTSAGHRSRNGRPFAAMQVARMLRSDGSQHADQS